MPGIKFNLQLGDFHKAHVRRNHDKEKTASMKEYRAIIYEMGNILGDEVIQNGIVCFPASTWKLHLLKRKTAYTDFNMSKEEKTQILRFNDHTDGYLAFFSLDASVNSHKSIPYKFGANRNLKREKLTNSLRNTPLLMENYKLVKDR